MTRRRVALVVQRFGEALVGGAEGHALAIAQTLASRHDVTVLTSCTRDAVLWSSDYPPGTSEEAGLRVMRFAHPQRNAGGRARVPFKHKLRMQLSDFFDLFRLPRVAACRGDDVHDGHQFLRRQGPFCEELVKTLKDDAAGFDAVVFMTALFYPTAEGLPAWGARSVLVPTLHDEKPMYLPCYRRVFATAGQVLYNTRAEQMLARRLYGDDAPEGRIVGVGVPAQTLDAAAVAAARQRHGLPERYLVYVGRVERAKGCGELLDAWQSVQAQCGDARLVFIGRGALPMDGLAGVQSLGFLPADERDAVVAGSAAVIVPSRLESLSLALLEALALGVPVIANGASAVLSDHVVASGGGVAYRGQAQLAAALQGALQRGSAERRALGEAGRRYVQAHYPPGRAEQAWLDAVERVCA